MESILDQGGWCLLGRLKNPLSYQLEYDRNYYGRRNRPCSLGTQVVYNLYSIRYGQRWLISSDKRLKLSDMRYVQKCPMLKFPWDIIESTSIRQWPENQAEMPWKNNFHPALLVFFSEWRRRKWTRWWWHWAQLN